MGAHWITPGTETATTTNKNASNLYWLLNIKLIQLFEYVWALLGLLLDDFFSFRFPLAIDKYKQKTNQTELDPCVAHMNVICLHFFSSFRINIDIMCSHCSILFFGGSIVWLLCCTYFWVSFFLFFFDFCASPYIKSFMYIVFNVFTLIFYLVLSHSRRWLQSAENRSIHTGRFDYIRFCEMKKMNYANKFSFIIW